MSMDAITIVGAGGIGCRRLRVRRVERRSRRSSRPTPPKSHTAKPMASPSIAPAARWPAHALRRLAAGRERSHLALHQVLRQFRGARASAGRRPGRPGAEWLRPSSWTNSATPRKGSRRSSPSAGRTRRTRGSLAAASSTSDFAAARPSRGCPFGPIGCDRPACSLLGLSPIFVRTSTAN